MATSESIDAGPDENSEHEPKTLLRVNKWLLKIFLGKIYQNYKILYIPTKKTDFKSPLIFLEKFI